MTYYYSCRIMKWNDGDPDDHMVYANTSHCVPERFVDLTTHPIAMDELFDYAGKIMNDLKERYNNVMLYCISGGDQVENSTDPYRVIWQNEITDNPGQSKAELLKAIKKSKQRN